MEVSRNKRTIKLLVSPKDLKEALCCIEGGADIIDVKNPKEGSLGGHAPRVINEIRGVVPDNLELSAAIGDIPNKPGMVAQAALGLATCGVGYIKIGLCDSFTVEEAVYLVKEAAETLLQIKAQAKIVVSGYADAQTAKIILPKHIPHIAHEGGAHVAMIDTLVKGNGKGLFDFLSVDELREFQSAAHRYGLRVALAGALKKEDILKIKKLNLCDLIGIRTLVCRDGDRSSSIEPSRIKEIKEMLIN